MIYNFFFTNTEFIYYLLYSKNIKKLINIFDIPDKN